MAGSVDVIRLLNAVQSPYALATPVVECVEDALQDEQLSLAGKAVEEIISERQRLMTAVADYDFVQKVWPSEANFFLMQVADAETVMQRCEENNVLLRHFGGNLSDCIRITIGSPTDNDQLLSTLDTLVES